MWLWPFVFCKCKTGRKIAQKIMSYIDNNQRLFFAFKLWSTLLIIIWFFLAENTLQVIWTVIFLIYHLLMCSLQYMQVAIGLFILVMFMPLMAWVFFQAWGEDFCASWLRLPEDNAVHEENQPPEPEPLFQRQDAAQQIADAQNNENRYENMNRAISFVPYQRLTTNKAKNNILNNWKKVFDPNINNKGEAWCICLEEFETGEMIIELKCGAGHIFHSICIEAWSMKNHSWPLWRTDFIEVAKNEPQNQHQEITNQVLNQDIVPDGALPVEFDEEEIVERDNSIEV